MGTSQSSDGVVAYCVRGWCSRATPREQRRDRISDGQLRELLDPQPLAVPIQLEKHVAAVWREHHVYGAVAKTEGAHDAVYAFGDVGGKRMTTVRRPVDVVVPPIVARPRARLR